LQAKSQAAALQTGVALAGVVHAAQAPAHSLKPALQVKPQVAAVQVALAPAGTGQAVHDAPQLPGFTSATQAWPQACWPWGQTQADAVQAAPVGHSVGKRQPGVQARVTGSQA
jgi:hypothetical protein